ncbi:MAG TPA: cytochrome c biogenesis protein DipZ [Gaiellaceae bacterium]|nr:cytochrome c biogenesis protein DipZ [Gaiellaceae bacterium]
MLVLLGIGFLAGLVTALSPCVLPVLPVLLAGSAAGGPRRPYAIVAGLVTTFTLSVLFAAWLLDLLGLPLDTLRTLALALLFLVAATLLFPQVGALVERPFARLTRRSGRDLGGGFLLGASLGFVMVPCAGPVLATIAVVAASREVGVEALLLTLAYSLGHAVPLLAFAVGGQRAGRLAAVRAHAPALRRALGAVIGATALAIALNVDRHFTTAIPGYTKAVQDSVEDSAAGRRALAGLLEAPHGPGAAATATLDDFGPAPDFRDITLWLNTPGGDSLSLAELRGKVVLVNFWTYSCVNCLRELPHVKAWYDAYRRAGFVVVAVHAPEFAFEHEARNVRRAVRDLGIRHPVALDNDFGTWNAYANRYWPANYLVDRSGHVRYVHFGEGKYELTEDAIRTLLATEDAPRAARNPDRTPTSPQTPETYLGWERLSSAYVGSAIQEGRMARYAFPATLPEDGFALAGRWRVEGERSVAGAGARLRIRAFARLVHLVLSGRGTVRVLVEGRPEHTVEVGANRLYTLADFGRPGDHVLELRLSPGLAAYAFTFSSSAAAPGSGSTRRRGHWPYLSTA